MEKLVSAYPGDATIASIYSEALMNTMPWNYWSDDLTAKPETQKVIDTLEGALENSPDHPLALHLYIHAMEASSTPERAEAPLIAWPTLSRVRVTSAYAGSYLLPDRPLQ